MYLYLYLYQRLGSRSKVGVKVKVKFLMRSSRYLGLCIAQCSKEQRRDIFSPRCFVPGHLSSAAKYLRCSDTRQVSPVLGQNGWSEQPFDTVTIPSYVVSEQLGQNVCVCVSNNRLD